MDEWVNNEFFWDSVFSDLLSRLATEEKTDVAGLEGAAVSFAAAAVHRLAGPSVIIAPSASVAESIRDDLDCLLEDVLYFPSYDSLPFEGEPAHPSIVSDRIECMARLKDGRRNSLVVMPASALAKRIPAPGSFHWMDIRKGMELSIEQLESWLQSAGYKREGSVWEQARWARRGGIVDVGTFGMENPVRLEFFGHRVDSIRSFDQRSQRSIRNLKNCRLLPAREAILTPDHWNRAMEVVAEEHPLSEKLWTVHDFPGIEHHLPVFFENTCSIMDYIPPGRHPDAFRPGIRTGHILRTR